MYFNFGVWFSIICAYFSEEDDVGVFDNLVRGIRNGVGH